MESNQIKPKKEYLVKIGIEFNCNLVEFIEAEIENDKKLKNHRSSLNSASNTIPVEFMDKMMDRMERMHEHMTSLMKEMISKLQ
jgi:hypothetical protein